MNKGVMSGIGIAVAGIAAGLLLENGKLSQLAQPTAALIVFGGTFGAVLVQFPFPVIVNAIRLLRPVFIRTTDPALKLIDELARFAAKARRNGMMSLDADLEFIKDPFLRKCMTLAVDGMHVAELRGMMEQEMDRIADGEEQIPRVYEAAGGFAPTIGILGAVIGLIQVMQRLENINEVGKGIAVAFVATLYGVGSANLFFLPCAGRIKSLIRRRHTLRELMLDGVVAIAERTTPRMLETKLSVYLLDNSKWRPAEGIKSVADSSEYSRTKEAAR